MTAYQCSACNEPFDDGAYRAARLVVKEWSRAWREFQLCPKCGDHVRNLITTLATRARDRNSPYTPVHVTLPGIQLD